MDIKDMAVVENTGTGSRIKEQNEKNEKFVGRDFLFPSRSYLPRIQQSETKW